MRAMPFASRISRPKDFGHSLPSIADVDAGVIPALNSDPRTSAAVEFDGVATSDRVEPTLVLPIHGQQVGQSGR